MRASRQMTRATDVAAPLHNLPWPEPLTLAIAGRDGLPQLQRMRLLLRIVVVSIVPILASFTASSNARAQSPLTTQDAARSETTSQPSVQAPPVIHWFVDNTAAAYELALAQHKPLVLATGDFKGVYFQRLRNEVFSSRELAQLAPYAIFAYADPSHDIVARNFGKVLGYDKWPIISLFAPNGDALDEEARIIGLFDAQTETAQLSKHMRSRGWLPPVAGSARAPWLPPY